MLVWNNTITFLDIVLHVFCLLILYQDIMCYIKLKICKINFLGFLLPGASGVFTLCVEDWQMNKRQE